MISSIDVLLQNRWGLFCAHLSVLDAALMDLLWTLGLRNEEGTWVKPHYKLLWESDGYNTYPLWNSLSLSVTSKKYLSSKADISSALYIMHTILNMMSRDLI